MGSKGKNSRLIERTVINAHFIYNARRSRLLPFTRWNNWTREYAAFRNGLRAVELEISSINSHRRQKRLLGSKRRRLESRGCRAQSEKKPSVLSRWSAPALFSRGYVALIESSASFLADTFCVLVSLPFGADREAPRPKLQPRCDKWQIAKGKWN